jgi:hypothetical protein
MIELYASQYQVVHTDTVVSAVEPQQAVVTPRRRRRARLAVLAGLAWAVLIPWSLSVAVQTDALPIRDPLFHEKAALLKTHPGFFLPHDQEGKTRVLAIGSSRTLLAWDAEEFSSSSCRAFNFGCSGCGPIASAVMLRRLFRQGFHAEVVLMELHPAMLADQQLPFEHRWLHLYRLDHEDVDTIRSFGWAMPTPDHLRPGGWLQSIRTFRLALLNHTCPSLLPCRYGMTLAGRMDHLGTVRGVEPEAGQHETMLQQAAWEYAPALVEYRPGGPAVRALQDMITQCRHHAIEPILVVLPESPRFRSWYGPRGNEQLDHFLKQFPRENGVRLIPARDWLEETDFADGHHATPRGASTYTRKLAECLRSAGVTP